jgi:hypothetical protein
MPSITRKAKTSFTRNKSLKKNKSPSISILKERSIQLQKGEPSILNKFTTKNVTVRDKNQNVWNTVENNKLAYKRSPRGAPIGTYPKIVYGPKIERLSKENYKKLKKGSKIYYDRESVAFRGPFFFEKVLRGPNLLVTAKDRGYLTNTYKFLIPVNKLQKQLLYYVVGKSPRHKTLKRKRKMKRSKTVKRKRHKKRKKRSKK